MFKAYATPKTHSSQMLKLQQKFCLKFMLKSEIPLFDKNNEQQLHDKMLAFATYTHTQTSANT